MSIDAGGLAHMTYNNNHNTSNVNGFPSNGLGNATSGFGARGSRLNSKRLSVALPPKVASINEDHADLPTPRTSRSHLLAGLRTQPKTPAVPASAPYHQTHHSTQGFGYGGYGTGMPQTATTANFDLSAQYGTNAGRQMYSLHEQVLAPPSMYDQAEEMDPSMLQQMQITSMYLAQRQQQLQQQLANITAAAQGLNLNGGMQRAQFQQNPMSPQNTQSFFQSQVQQQQVQSPIEVPGQPGVYLVFNPATNAYSYVLDQSVQMQHQQQQALSALSPVHQTQAGPFSPSSFEPAAAFNGLSNAAHERTVSTNTRSITPPKKAPSPPSTLAHVEPLPPPSATAFRRGHKKASSLAIHPSSAAMDGPKTSSNATFGSQRSVFPPTPMTGTFGPGAARAGEHPIRQPRGPPPLEELTTAPTSKHEGSKNFATRQRRRALDDLVRARSNRRGVSRSSNGSPVSEGEFSFSVGDDVDDFASLASSGSNTSRKMSPIGSEMKEKRNSRGSNDGYFGLSSASSSEGEDTGIFKQPPTPATPGVLSGDRKRMMLGVLNAAEKRKSFAM